MISALRRWLRRDALPLAIWVTSSSKYWPRTLATIPEKPSSSRRLTSSISIRNRGAPSPPGSMLTLALTSKLNFRHPRVFAGFGRPVPRSGRSPGDGTRPRSGRRPETVGSAGRSRRAGRSGPCPDTCPAFSNGAGGSFSMTPSRKSLPSLTSAPASAGLATATHSRKRRGRSIASTLSSAPISPRPPAGRMIDTDEVCAWVRRCDGCNVPTGRIWSSFYPQSARI